MQIWNLTNLVSHETADSATYHEFLRASSLSTGIYVLPANGVDPQQPHTEDEVYYVVSGSGRIRVGEEDEAVGAGSVIFVEAGVEHRFHSIDEGMVVLVLFAPAEYSQRGEGS